MPFSFRQPPVPRISVIIRTLGRPELAQAVESVCMQTIAATRHALEIVLVNAANTVLPSFDLQGIVMREARAGRPLNRPEAANVGLEAATGDYICFLDDDDWFHPEHLQSLLDVLKATPGARVAYSGVLLVHADGRPYARLSRPFSRDALFRENYIQMGAALFERSLLDDGPRFDETLLNFQDWDFWLQLAELTDFVHSGQVTLSWRALSGSSGSGMGPNANQALQAAYTQRVRQKWAGRTTRSAHSKSV